MKQLGIITALASEAACLTASPPAPNEPTEIVPGLTLILCGIGQERAQQAATRLVDLGTKGLISFGTAGGLSRKMQSGDLCCPAQIVCESSGVLPTDKDWHASMCKALSKIPLSIHTEALYSGCQVVTSPQKKIQLHKQTRAVAIDMESAAIMGVANKNGIPCIVLRSIVDTPEMNIPACVMTHTDQFGNAKLSAMLRTLLAHPSQIPELIKLGKRFRAASSSLKQAARATVLSNCYE